MYIVFAAIAASAVSKSVFSPSLLDENTHLLTREKNIGRDNGAVDDRSTAEKRNNREIPKT